MPFKPDHDKTMDNGWDIDHLINVVGLRYYTTSVEFIDWFMRRGERGIHYNGHRSIKAMKLVITLWLDWWADTRGLYPRLKWALIIVILMKRVITFLYHLMINWFDIGITELSSVGKHHTVINVLCHCCKVRLGEWKFQKVFMTDQLSVCDGNYSK